MEGVGVVEGEDEDGGLGVLVVAGGDAGHALHAAGVPKLELQGALRRRKGKFWYIFDTFTAVEWISVLLCCSSQWLQL